MPLKWDPLLVRELARELDRRLAGVRLRALRLDGRTRNMTLLFREATLAWPLHPAGGAPRLLPAAEPEAGDLPLPSRVRRVLSPADERILIFELQPLRGRGGRELVVELLGNQWNALVVEGPEQRIRHLLVRRDGPRVARVGLPYTPPPASARAGVDGTLELARWREILEGSPPADRLRALVAAVAWTSPVNAGALVAGDPDPARALEVGHALWTAWVGATDTAPVLAEGDGAFQPYPWLLPDRVCTATADLLSAFDAWAGTQAPDGPGTATALPAELIAALERRVDAAQRRRTRLEAEWASLEDAERLRSLGDLLLARLAEVPPGAERVTLEDFDGNPVTLDLDPRRPVHESAADLYERAARVERARERLPNLRDEAARSEAELEELLARARSGEATPEEIRGAGAGDAVPGPGGPQPGETLPYRRFISTGGLEIRVGRSSRHNDDLTFHHASPDDVWLHARHAAGAHVILRWGREGNPPRRDLEEAAVLAAVHSRARTSGTVPVDWTRRKYVRKPRGAAPGAVVPQRVATVFVAPDESLVERLSRG